MELNNSLIIVTMMLESITIFNKFLEKINSFGQFLYIVVDPKVMGPPGQFLKTKMLNFMSHFLRKILIRLDLKKRIL